MNCKKCKNLIREGDWEYYIAHNLEGHGVRPQDTKQLISENIGIKEFNEDLIKEVIKLHNETGKKGVEMFKRKLT